MDKSLWKSSTKTILTGAKLYLICNLIAAIFDLVPIPVIDSLGSMAEGASVVGLFIFMFGIRAFKGVVDSTDLPNVQKINIALTLNICAIFLDFIPIAGGFIAGGVNIVAFIFMLLGFSGLKNSVTMPTKAKKGASKLFLGAIIAIVSSVFGFIPLMGDPIAAILNVVVLVLYISGWKLFAEEQEDTTIS